MSKREPIGIWFCRLCRVAGFIDDAMAGRCWATGNRDGKRRVDCPLPPADEKQEASD
jgi:hypothetical protein